jgi:hypothetical protein
MTIRTTFGLQVALSLHRYLSVHFSDICWSISRVRIEELKQD